jgi:hypothetical protein
MAGYIGSKASVVSSGAERKKTFTITGATTSLTGLNYTVGKVHVFQNGVRLVDGTDYTATNGTTITLTAAAQNGDNVVVISQAAFQVADALLTSGGTMTGALTTTGLTVDGNLTFPTNTAYTSATTIRNNSNALIFSGGTSGYYFNRHNNSATDLSIDSSGQVGIGTDSPLSLLDVTLEATGQRRFLVNYDDSAITIKGSNASSNPESLRAVASTFKVNTGTSGSGTERMRITSSGNVGINEPSPDDKVTINVGSSDNVRAIHLVGGPDITNKYVSIGRTHTVSNDYIDSEIRFGAEVGGSGSSFLAFATGSNNSTERMRIDNSGRVTTPYQPSVRLNLAGHIGINNSAPSYPGVQVNNFTVKENVGSHWNNTNNTFTCPVTGVYCISVFYIKYPASGAAHVDIHKNGSASSIDVRWRASEGDSSYEQAAGTVFVSCAANDILDWHYFGAPGLHSGNGQWSIRLVG